MLSIQLLRDKQLVEQLNALQIKGGDKRLQRLIAMAPTVNKNHQKLITQRKTAYFTKPGDIARGRLAFTTYCASCHQIGGQGASIGPSLDGIGSRGLDRLLEDIIDPERNDDPAFSVTLITTKKGKVISGIGARQT